MLEFLDFLSESFELIVFCSGSELYCSPVLDAIEAKRKYFAYRLYGSHVLFENQKFSVKYYDFLMAGSRSVQDTIIVDCDVGTYCLNLSNGVPVSPFVTGSDFELVHLAKYLEGMRDAKDVSAIVSRSFKKYLGVDKAFDKKTKPACRVATRLE